MTIWLTSDTHFGHERLLSIIDFDGAPVRSFSSVEEMDETMVERWNKLVKPSDHVYHLGDVTMRRRHLGIVRRLNGHKRLIGGNHDIFEVEDYLEAGFEKIMAMRVLNNVLLTHVPIHPSSLFRYAGNIHGHLHRAPSPPGPYLSVCTEQTGFAPVTLEAACTLLAEKKAVDSETTW